MGRRPRTVVLPEYVGQYAAMPTRQIMGHDVRLYPHHLTVEVGGCTDYQTPHLTHRVRSR